MTEDNHELVELLENEHLDTTQLVKKVDNVMNRVKFKAFGKVTIKDARPENRELDKMYVRRKELIENKENEKVIEIENEITGKLLDVQRTEYETKLKYLGN